ncbi:Lon protease family protein [Pseudodesulfovibrio senegalensis]|uniref:endopeptidase La n=1 Tax=Pseudodesulfovibrio senegalensis TaxID=1721087 RepID=A0A6N6MZI0_9BACT|nr:ATP-binding protein [Pseudodesulfovibrio senegalensis]KAB1441101.1 AAA family ATPase [Pseudodesulfovibrio senegalensis]
MAGRNSQLKVSLDQLRWTMSPDALPFESTAELEPLTEIIGQERGVQAFRFGIGMDKKGYNLFVTGEPGTGRMAMIRKLLAELNRHGEVPNDLCYVNNFKHSEEPLLLRLEAGKGNLFKKRMHEFTEGIKQEVPQLFESEEYIARKNELAEAHEKQVMGFYKAIEEKVKDTGLVMVRMQMGPLQRPDIVPLVDGEPKRLIQLEEMVENGRFPREEFERLREKRKELKEEIDHIVQEIKELHKAVGKKHEEVDRLMFMNLAEEILLPLRHEFQEEKVARFLDSVLENMVEHLDEIKTLGVPQKGPLPGMVMPGVSPEHILRPYAVNLLVDNSEQEGPPVIIESYPTYRNLFGSIERVMDRAGGWRTDFTKIKAGSFVKANGGYLVINLLDAIMEPGVWSTLKRSLKTEQIEIETYDPYYFITATGLKPERIGMNVKVVVLGDNRLWALLRHYDPDMHKIFKARVDFDTAMDRNDRVVEQLARFVRSEVEKREIRPFSSTAVAAVLEHLVRLSGRKEKLSAAFPRLADLLVESDYQAKMDNAETVEDRHVLQALDDAVYRANRVEERLQEMIDRGSLFVDVEGEVVGQINGLAVYSFGDYMFGKPSRITAVTSMGKDGIINIERESELSGPIHNKGMQILSGYLRSMFAQDKPLTLAASIAFEQAYGGIDGDSASSTELYALLSSLADVPLRQDIAVTGSVNQRGQIQPIGGVNEKIEGFFLCCKKSGLTGSQGVMIPKPNVKDLMLRHEVVEAIRQGQFNVWAVSSIDQGIELLTGRKAGKRTKAGYTKNSVFEMVDRKLRALAEGLREFGKSDDSSRTG